MRPTLHDQPGFQVPGRARCFSGTPFAIEVERALRWKGVDFAVNQVAWRHREAVFGRIGPARLSSGSPRPQPTATEEPPCTSR